MYLTIKIIIPSNLTFLRGKYSKIFNHLLYDWRLLTLLEIKLNLIELINSGIPMIINN